MLVTGRSATGMGARWVKRAMQMARRLLAAKPRYATKHEVVDGYLLSATRTNTMARGTVMDFPQYLLCPTLLRVPLTAGFASVQNVVAPAGYRDLWQPDRQLDPLTPVLPVVDRDGWGVSTARSYAFGGALAGELAITQFGAVLQHPGGVGNTDQRVGTAVHASVAGFRNASVNQPYHVLTRFIDSAANTAGSALESGTVTAHHGNMEFNSEAVDQLNSGWVAIPRAMDSYSYASPPPWVSASALWGRGFFLYREVIAGVSSTWYLAMARVFEDKVSDGTAKPTHEPGALWLSIARVDATRDPDTAEIIHAGLLSAQQIVQTVRPSYPFAVEACVVGNGVHALVHSRVVDPNALGVYVGENTYSLVAATWVDGASYSIASLDSDNDARSGRHFYGGASVDGVSYFLYPDFNDVQPGSQAGEMAVLRYDGSLTRSVVVTPMQYQKPGMGLTAGTGLVCHIGLGLLGFVVTLTPPAGDPYETPFDVTFCTYDPLTGVVQTRGQIAQATIASNTGYPCAAGGIGAVTVVQRARQVGEQPPGSAVLLWSTNSGSNPPNGGTKYQGWSFVSYDSGLTWHQISDTVGDSRGTVLIGSLTRPVRQGHAWVKPLE